MASDSDRSRREPPHAARAAHTLCEAHHLVPSDFRFIGSWSAQRHRPRSDVLSGTPPCLIHGIADDVGVRDETPPLPSTAVACNTCAVPAQRCDAIPEIRSQASNDAAPHTTRPSTATLRLNRDRYPSGLRSHRFRNRTIASGHTMTTPTASEHPSANGTAHAHTAQRCHGRRRLQARYAHPLSIDWNYAEEGQDSLSQP